MATRDTLGEAQRDCEAIVEAMPKDLRIHALTALYMMRNSLINEVQKDLAKIIEEASDDE